MWQLMSRGSTVHDQWLISGIYWTSRYVCSMRQRPRCMLSGRLPYRLIRLKRWGSPMVGSVQFLAHVSAVSMNNLLHWSILPLVAYTNIHWRLVCFIYENFIVFLFFCPSLLTVYLKPVYFLKSGFGKLGQVCMLDCGVGAKMFTRLWLMQ